MEDSIHTVYCISDDHTYAYINNLLENRSVKILGDYRDQVIGPYVNIAVNTNMGEFFFKICLYRAIPSSVPDSTVVVLHNADTPLDIILVCLKTNPNVFGIIEDEKRVTSVTADRLCMDGYAEKGSALLQYLTRKAAGTTTLVPYRKTFSSTHIIKTFLRDLQEDSDKESVMKIIDDLYK
jgi:hypothetical protein